MRNKEFYLVILKQKTMDWAYAYITENLKRPSFVYEPQNAYAAYKEIFGVDFASPEEMKTASLAEENARLREELELAKIAAKQKETVTIASQSPVEDAVAEVPESVTTSTNAVGDTTNPVVYGSKEEFVKAHPEITDGRKMHHSWLKYVKESKVQK